MSTFNYVFFSETPKRSDSTEKEVKSAASGTKRKKSTSGQFSKRIKMEAESSTKAAVR